MKFSSSAGRIRDASAEKAILDGLPADGGLYQPNEIPLLQAKFFEALSKLSLAEIAFQVLKPYFLDEIPESELENIVGSTFSFPAPLVEVESNIWAMELFHGPTCAFKDFGARYLARVTSYFRRNESK